MRRLIIDGLPPSVNHLYHNALINGRRMRVLNKKGKLWREDARLMAMIWAKRNRWTKSDGKVVMRLWFYYPDKRRRDSHNFLKLIADSLEGILYEDDKMLLPQIIDFEVDRERPRVEIELEEVA